MESVLGILVCLVLPIVVPVIFFVIQIDKKQKEKINERKAIKEATENPPQEIPLLARLEQQYFVYEICVPKTEKFSPERSKHLLEQISANGYGNFVLQIRGTRSKWFGKLSCPRKTSNPSRNLQQPFKRYIPIHK